MYGWMGEILQVDLTDAKITRFETQPYAEKYLGGRGIASRLYWEMVEPGIGAYDPENRLIFIAGTLVATGVQAATYMSVVGKSPMTLPESYCYGSIGGFVGAELKNAGFDGVVITGRASRPIYLWIHDGEAELRDASSLWGQNAYRTGEMLQGVHGERTRFITTGLAGENLVRTALITASHESTCSAGFGAVMGSKNLKALAIRGTGHAAVADRSALKELNRFIVSIGHHMDTPATPMVMGTKYEKLVKSVDKGKCYQCGMECLRMRLHYGDGLEGYRKCQSIEYYMPSKLGREDEPIETFFKAPALANDYSLDSWELRHIVDWLYACQQAGALADDEIGLPLSRIGTGEFLEKLIHAIATRQGFGDVLAEGMARARDRVPDRSKALLRFDIAPIGVADIYQPRVYVAHALLYSMEPRIHHNILHEIPLTTGAWARNRHMPEASPVTTAVFRNIARAFWGSGAAAEVSGYGGKALAARMIQDRTYLKESLGLCDFAWPITYSENIPGYVGDPDLMNKVFAAVTGLPGGELENYAARIGNMQRAILLREGRQVPEADYPPGYNFTEPLRAALNFGVTEVPGPGDTVVGVTGNMLDRDKFTDMLKEYYRLRGWDEDTGHPLPATLAALGMADVAV